MNSTFPNLDPAHPPARLSREWIGQIMANLRWRAFDDPTLTALALRLLRFHPHQDPNDIKQFVMGVHVRRVLSEASQDAFLGAHPPVGQIPTGPRNIPVVLLPTGEWFTLPPFPHHVMLCGASGTGKTTLLRHLVPPLVASRASIQLFDRKQDFLSLANHPQLTGQVVCLDANDHQYLLYPRSPQVLLAGQPSPLTATWSQEDLQHWTTRTDGALTDLAGRATGRMFAQRLLLQAIQAFRADHPDAPAITILQLMDALEDLRCRGNAAYDRKSSALEMLNYLNHQLGASFRFIQTDFVQRLTAQPGAFIHQVGGIPGDLYGFIASLFVFILCAIRDLLPTQQHTPVIVITDDATTALTSAQDRLSASGVSPLAEQVFMARSRNIGFILVSHAPASDISPFILRNIETFIFTSIVNESVRFLRETLGLNDEQIQQCRAMTPGQALVYSPSRHPQAVLGTFPPQTLPAPDDSWRRAARAHFLATVHSQLAPTNSTSQAAGPSQSSTTGTPGTTSAGSASRTTGSSAPSGGDSGGSGGGGGGTSGGSGGGAGGGGSGGVERMELRLLLLLAESTPPPLRVIGERLGLSPAQISRTVAKLVARGYLRRYDAPTSHPGRPLSVLILTDAAWKLMQDHGLAQKPPLRTHGGGLHELALSYLEAVTRANGHRIAFNVDIGGVVFDATVTTTDDRTHHVQVGVSDEQREANNLLRVSQFPALRDDFHGVLITLNRRFFDRTITLMRRAEPVNPITARIRNRLIGDLIHQVWDPQRPGPTTNPTV